MRLPLKAGAILFICIALAACVGPMSQREAQGYAATSIRRYCAETNPCGTLRVVKAQRLGDGWMVDFETPTTTYGVMVHNDGNTQVTAWKKDAAQTR
jgi:hypothetical protein